MESLILAKLNNITAQQNFHTAQANFDLVYYEYWRIDYAQANGTLQAEFEKLESDYRHLLWIKSKHWVKCTGRYQDNDDSKIHMPKAGTEYRIKEVTADGFVELFDFPGLKYNPKLFTDTEDSK